MSAAALTPTPASPAGGRPSAGAVLDRAVAAMAAKRRVEVEVLAAALAWAHAHTVAREDAEDAGGAERVAGWRSDTIHTPGSAAALFGDRALPIAGRGHRWWRSSR